LSYFLSFDQAFGFNSVIILKDTL